MKKPTKKERNRIYKLALERINNGGSELHAGLCRLFTRVDSAFYYRYGDYFYSTRPDEFEVFFESKRDNYFRDYQREGNFKVRRVIVELLIAMTE